ncbi:MAG TPA: response regulator [bacterium]|nr:response regulator [bacterium]
MSEDKSMLPILMVDDDKDDRFLTEKALRANRVINPIRFLEDGEEMLEYLQRKGKFLSPGSAPKPCFILLDLNMPKMDGRQALEILKADPELRRIPVVILTTSQAEEDIIRSYNLGANSFITKPINFDRLVELMASLKEYWLEIVELPTAATEPGH